MKTSRNDPCPCGSGKKFKRCCGLAPSRPLTPAETLDLKLMDFAGLGRWRELREDVFASVLELVPEELAEEDVLTFLGYPLIAGQLALHLLLDREVEGATILDTFLAERGHRLEPAEREVAEQLRDCALSLYRITALEEGRVELHDAWLDRAAGWAATGEELPFDAHVGDLVALRLRRGPDGAVVFGAALPFVPDDEEELLEALAEDLRAYVAEGEDLTPERYRRVMLPILVATWIDGVLFDEDEQDGWMPETE
ncbi:MAG: SEC-C domain-containing protein [Planctomycetes bacterium]|nr:SEC-C domain-containing protein [Planctomycetota bacterium]